MLSCSFLVNIHRPFIADTLYAVLQLPPPFLTIQCYLQTFIQPNLGLPRNLTPLLSILPFFAIHRSSILSMCPNQRNTLWSTLLANSFSNTFPHQFAKDMFNISLKLFRLKDLFVHHLMCLIHSLWNIFSNS